MLGFRIHGYSLDCPNGLVLWEAQFSANFVNVAQPLIDPVHHQPPRTNGGGFRASVLLLPHGMEGQGLGAFQQPGWRRFLQQGAEENIQIVCPHDAGPVLPLPSPADAAGSG